MKRSEKTISIGKRAKKPANNYGLSKSVPISVYQRIPKAPRLQPSMQPTEEPDLFALPPTPDFSVMPNFAERFKGGRSLQSSNTRDLPSSMPTDFLSRKLGTLSITQQIPGKRVIRKHKTSHDGNDDPDDSSSMNSGKANSDDQIVGSFTLFQLLKDDNKVSTDVKRRQSEPNEASDNDLEEELEFEMEDEDEDC